MALTPTEPPTWRLALRLFPPILLPIFLAVVDQTIVAAALPTIAGSLGDVERVSWIVVGYLLANTIAAPVYGRLGDVFGRRRMMLIALGVFVLASLFCAMAGSIVQLTLARILQGLGGGGLMVQAQALISEAVPPRQRGRYQGYLSAVIVCSSSFGPVAGGFLTGSFGWPAVFLINLPLGLVAMLAAWRLPSRASRPGRLRFDLAGLLLFAGGVVPLLLALERARHPDLAALPWMLACLAASGACLALLLWHESRVAQPLFPLPMLRQPAMWRSNAMAACSGALLISEVSFLPIYLQVVDGASPAQIGLLMLPLTVTVGLGSIITGQLITRTGRSALFPAVGQMVTAATLAALAVYARHLSLWQLPVALAFAAVFQGSAMPVAQVTSQMMAGPGQLGTAAAAITLSRSVGSAIGVALVGAVLFALLAAADDATAALFAEMVSRGPAAMTGLPPARQAAIQGQIADAFGGAFLTIAAFAATSSALAWTLPVRSIG